MSTKTLDAADALKRLGGDQELYLELLHVFLSEQAAMLGAVEQAAAAGDPARLDRAAHTLKGACSNISAVEARGIALELEIAGKESNLDRAEILLPQLKTALNAVEREAKQLIAEGI